MFLNGAQVQTDSSPEWPDKSAIGYSTAAMRILSRTLRRKPPEYFVERRLLAWNQQHLHPHSITTLHAHSITCKANLIFAAGQSYDGKMALGTTHDTRLLTPSRALLLPHFAQVKTTVNIFLESCATVRERKFPSLGGFRVGD